MPGKVPIVREISWPAVFPQLLSLVAAVPIFVFTLGWGREALIWGAVAFLGDIWVMEVVDDGSDGG